MMLLLLKSYVSNYYPIMSTQYESLLITLKYIPNIKYKRIDLLLNINNDDIVNQEQTNINK